MQLGPAAKPLGRSPVPSCFSPVGVYSYPTEGTASKSRKLTAQTSLRPVGARESCPCAPRMHPPVSFPGCSFAASRAAKPSSDAAFAIEPEASLPLRASRHLMSCLMALTTLIFMFPHWPGSSSKAGTTSNSLFVPPTNISAGWYVQDKRLMTTLFLLLVEHLPCAQHCVNGCHTSPHQLTAHSKTLRVGICIVPIIKTESQRNAGTHPRSSR